MTKEFKMYIFNYY